MNQITETSLPEDPSSDAASLNLGRWMGRREAFSLMAGSSAAADVESLRRIRDEKAYRELNCNWEEFCEKHLRVSRRSVDRAIRNLEEFGPQFFQITHMAHISPKEYRAIAEHVTDTGVCINGNVVALLPENSDRVSAAVADLLGRAEAKNPTPAAPQIDAVLKRCRSAADELERLPVELDGGQKLELAAAVIRIRSAAAALGVAILDL